MKTIYKYKIEGITKINLPIESQIVSVAGQENNVFIWVLINDSREEEYRVFKDIETGQTIEDNMHYIGTAHMNTGLVHHVFEII